MLSQPHITLDEMSKLSTVADLKVEYRNVTVLHSSLKQILIVVEDYSKIKPDFSQEKFMPFIGLKRITLSALVLLTSSSLFAAEILVSAASSLTNAFSEIGQTYQQTHPETQVKFNFAASGALLQHSCI